LVPPDHAGEMAGGLGVAQKFKPKLRDHIIVPSHQVR
jgi:hypothetical protein